MKNVKKNMSGTLKVIKKVISKIVLEWYKIKVNVETLLKTLFLFHRNSYIKFSGIINLHVRISH